MLRFLARLLGLLLMAGGFVALVYDGARSIANNALRSTSVADVFAALFKDRAGAVQTRSKGSRRGCGISSACLSPWRRHAS